MLPHGCAGVGTLEFESWRAVRHSRLISHPCRAGELAAGSCDGEHARMKVKPWQFVVIALGLLVGAGSLGYLVFFTDGAPQVKQLMHCVDVETGEIYRINTEKNRLVLPARHPQTGRVCLLRIKKDDQGKWFVDGRDLGTIKLLDEGVENKAVDAQTGDLLLPVKEPVEYVRKWE